MKRIDTRTKLKKIKRMIQESAGAVVAFSGGVDSSLLLTIACEVLETKVIAVTAYSLLNPPHELERAKRIASMLKCEHRILHPALLKNRRFIRNSRDRCYICKHAILTRLKKIAQPYQYIVMEASNASDTRDFRPGLKACEKLHIISPFIVAGLRKNEIRILARRYDLPNWNTPSSACLASRIPYNTPITRTRLTRIAKGEHYLLGCGIDQVRVRDHNTIARIELRGQDLARILDRRTRIVRFFRKLGYKYIVLDLEGYRTGSLNE